MEQSNPSLFNRMRKAATRAVANASRKFASSVNVLGKAMGRLKGETDPDAPPSTRIRDVRRLLPRSAFTKRGRGVNANVRLALSRMTPEQRAVVRAQGWLGPKRKLVRNLDRKQWVRA